MDQPGSSIDELNSRQKQQSQRHILREVRMGADRPKPEIIAAISKWDPKPPPQAQRANAECNENQAEQRRVDRPYSKMLHVRLQRSDCPPRVIVRRVRTR